MKVPPSGTMARRYPALLLLIGAGLLALLLPSALNVPTSDPGTLSEFAPVPGQGQGSGDISSLGQGRSGGLGFGVEVGEHRGPDAPGQLAKQTRPRLKRCVGSPPRQTEDPLSPPCVAYFEGDNFGATSKGVSRDEVRVVLYPEAGVVQNPNTFVDCLKAPAADDTEQDHYCKAFTRFFNDRYQTYGRTVHVWLYHQQGSSATSQEARVSEIDEHLRPFGITTYFATNAAVSGIARAARQRQIMTTFYAGLARTFFSDLAPYAIAFRPDREDHAALAASYICNKLVGRPPRYAGAGVDTSRPRKFGFLSGDTPFERALSESLQQGCGLRVTDTANLNSVTPAEISKLRTAEVSTVIVFGLGGNVTVATQNATHQGWFPEWFIPGDPFAAGLDTNASARNHNQLQWERAFGITLDYRRDRMEEQPWYRAYREGCPGCPEPRSPQQPYVYDELTMLFYGIQAAGPRLTPQSIDKGLHAIEPSGSVSPYRPAAYFAPGNYTFVKDAAAIWWDPTGTAPGDARPGCYRLVDGGTRSRIGEWSSGDEDVRASNSVCQGTGVS